MQERGLTTVGESLHVAIPDPDQNAGYGTRTATPGDAGERRLARLRCFQCGYYIINMSWLLFGTLFIGTLLRLILCGFRRISGSVEDDDTRIHRAVLYSLQGGVSGAGNCRLACALTLAGPPAAWDRAVVLLRRGDVDAFVQSTDAHTLDGRKGLAAMEAVRETCLRLRQTKQGGVLGTWLLLRDQLGLAALERVEEHINKTHTDARGLAQHSGNSSAIRPGNLVRRH